MTKSSNDKKFNETLKTLLKTPPKHHLEALAEGDIFAVIDGVMRIVKRPKKNEDESMTGILYRNVRDYKNDKPMDPSFTFWL